MACLPVFLAILLTQFHVNKIENPNTLYVLNNHNSLRLGCKFRRKLATTLVRQMATSNYTIGCVKTYNNEQGVLVQMPDGNIVQCRLCGKIRKGKLKAANKVTVGCFVYIRDGDEIVSVIKQTDEVSYSKAIRLFGIGLSSTTEIIDGEMIDIGIDFVAATNRELMEARLNAPMSKSSRTGMNLYRRQGGNSRRKEKKRIELDEETILKKKTEDRYASFYAELSTTLPEEDQEYEDQVELGAEFDAYF